MWPKRAESTGRAEIAGLPETARQPLAVKPQERAVFKSPQRLKPSCQLQLGGLSHEFFAVPFLDSPRRLIRMKTLFHRRLSRTAVYLREAARRALAPNGFAVLPVHQRLSGVAKPPRPDERLIQGPLATQALPDTPAIDHQTAGSVDVICFTERGPL